MSKRRSKVGARARDADPFFDTEPRLVDSSRNGGRTNLDGDAGEDPVGQGGGAVWCEDGPDVAARGQAQAAERGAGRLLGRSAYAQGHGGASPRLRAFAVQPFAGGRSLRTPPAPAKETSDSRARR